MNKHPLEPLVYDYLYEKDLTKETFELYQTILKQYISYLKEHNIKYASTLDVKNYISHKQNQGYSKRWIYNQISAIKLFYRYLKEHALRLNIPKVYLDDVTLPIKNIKIEQRITKEILTIEQAKQLILKTKQNRKYIWQYRDHAIVYLMLTSGLRSVEIRRAKISDIQKIQGKHILYVQGKNRTYTDAFVKLTDGVYQAIKDYLNQRNDKNPYLFISHSRKSDKPYLSRTFFLRMFKRILRESDLSHLHITPHSLRHTAATLNLLRGGNLEETKQLLRHSNLSSTFIYLKHIENLSKDASKTIEDAILNSKDDMEWKIILYMSYLKSF